MVGDIASELVIKQLSKSMGTEMNDNMSSLIDTPVGQQVVEEVSKTSKGIVSFMNENSVPILLGLVVSVFTYSIMRVLKVDNSAALEDLLPSIEDAHTEPVKSETKAAKAKLKNLKVKAAKKNKG